MAKHTGFYSLIFAFLFIGPCCTKVQAQVPRSLPEAAEFARFHLTRDSDQDLVNFMNHAGSVSRPRHIWDALTLSPRLYNVSEKCYNGTRRVLDGLVNKESWAIKVVDATGKLGSGVLLGNVHWWGGFTECQSIMEPLLIQNASDTRIGHDVEVFEGLPCTASVSTISNASSSSLAGMMGIQLGVCVPSECTAVDVRHLVNNLLFLLPADYQADSVTCRSKELPEYDAAAIAMICVLSFLGLLIVIATLYDLLFIQGGWNRYKPVEATEVPPNGDIRPITSEIFQNDERSPLLGPVRGKMQPPPMSICVKLLLSFSVCTNAAKLLSTKKTATSLDAVHGIRFISMTWVILGHTYVFGIGSVVNVLDLLSLTKTWHFQAIANALVSVDSFFLLSGLLLSYLLLKELESKGGPRKINWIQFYFHRFWRLTPPYMIILGAETALSKYWGTGPIWPTETGLDNACTKDWWANLLYVNNLLHDHMMCMNWSWFLANDMQFFLISPLLLIPFYFHWLAGLLVTMTVLLTSTVLIAVITVHSNYPAAFVDFFNKPAFDVYMHYFQDVYIAPWCRIGPYLIGIMYGYLIFKTKRKVKIHWGISMMGWLVAAVCALAVLYGLYGPASGHPLSESVTAFYAALHRTVWAGAVGWVVFACVTGYGGWVNAFLSWRPFLPLSRLTYMAYLVHPIVLKYGFSNLKRAIFADNLTLVTLFLGYVVISYGVAFIASLSLEAPMMGLEKALLKR